jgi:hypothetical protein
LSWLRCDTDEDPLAPKVEKLTAGELAALRPYVLPI